MEVAPRENWAILGNGMYVIRTGAGLRKAIRHFNEGENPKGSAPVNYPTQYPCVASFHWGYCGYEFIGAKYTTFNKLKSILIEHDNCYVAAIPKAHQPPVA